MKRVQLAIFCLISGCGLLFSSHAENLISAKIGTTWPQALLQTGICSGDAALQYGLIFNRKLGFGLAADFLWNTKSQEMRDSSSGLSRIAHAEKCFMFPIMAFFLLDPVPDLIVHPSAQFQIGYNSMVSGTSTYDSTQNKNTSKYNYFNGLIIKGIIDAGYDLGENVTIFLGVEYQWAETKSVDINSPLFSKRDMSGIGLRFGFRAAM